MKWWQTIVPQIESAGTITTADGWVLGILCDSLAKYMAAEVIVRRDGAILEDVRGGSRQHPAARVAARAGDRIMRLLVEVGGTPRSRSGLPPAPKQPEDDGGISRFLRLH